MSSPITADTLKGISLDALVTLRDEYRDNAQAWSTLTAIVETELVSRHSQDVVAALDRENRATNRLVPTPGIEYKGERKKNVKWDSEKLLPLAGTMPWEQARELFKFDVSVPEKIYGALAATNPALKPQIDAARTVEYKTKVTVERLKG